VSSLDQDLSSALDQAEAVTPRRQTLYDLDEHLQLLLESRDNLLAEQAEAMRPNPAISPAEGQGILDDVNNLLANLEQDIKLYAQKLATKVDGCAGVLRELKALATIRKEEGQRLLASAEQAERSREYLERVILETMQALGVKSYQGKLSKLTCAGNGGLQPLKVDPTLLGPDMLTIQVRMVLSKWLDLEGSGQVTALGLSQPEPWNQEIRDRLALGQKVEGAKLEPRGKHLRVT